MISSSSGECAGRKFMCVTTKKKKTYLTLNVSTVVVMEVETKNPIEVF